MKYPVNETFYSLKGEGRWTGHPMFFIRLSGCNVNCSWCDTPHQTFEWRDVGSLIKEAKNYPTNKIVITGGEPLIHDLSLLLSEFRKLGYSTHLETNGAIIPRPHYRFSWIAASPKNLAFKSEAIQMADEVKCLVGIPSWKLIAIFVKVHAKPDAYLYLMPLAKSWQEGERTERDLLQDNIQEAIDYCLANPRFGLCMQLHKILRIK